MDEIRQQLLILLEVINFTEDKHAFVETFLANTQADVLSTLALKIPKNELKSVKEFPEDEQADELSRLLKEHFDAQEYNDTFQEVFNSNLKSAISEVMPNLTPQQTALFENYLQKGE